MKRKIVSALIAVFFVLPYVWASDDELNAAMTRAGEARSRAMDFESHYYFPGEWEAAEEKYLLAGQLPRSGDDEIREAVNAYNAASNAFEAIFALALPLYAQAREDEIMMIRDELIAARARDLFREYFVIADQEAILALEQYEAGDIFLSRETTARALEMFRVMEIAYNAWLVRLDIVQGGFDRHDPALFEQADNSIEDAMIAFAERNVSAARSGAEEALRLYRLVFSVAAGVTDTAEEVVVAEQRPVDQAVGEEIAAVAEQPAGQAGEEIAVAEQPAGQAGEEIAEDVGAVLQLPDGTFPLPATYTVRSWRIYGDSLWNIAGKPWVFGNPRMWRVLFEANRSIMPDPNNPDLIEPGMVLEIPSIRGEIRQGEWVSGRTYPPLP